MATLYRVKDWKKHFEKADHRKCSYMHWLSLPTKHDGKGYNRLARLPNSVAVFTGWILILQTAAKMPNRGTLADSDGPLTAQDLADKTHFPESVFIEALEACSSPAIGWIERIEVSGTGNPAVSGPSGDLPESSGDLPDTLRRLSGASGGIAESSGGMPESSGGSGQSSGASGGSGNSSGDLPESSGVHDKTRHNRQNIINNCEVPEARNPGFPETEKAANPEPQPSAVEPYDGPTEIDASNRSDELHEGAAMTENRKKVYHAIRDTHWAGQYLGSKHLDELVAFTERVPVEWVCQAIRKASNAKDMRFGEAFVSYVKLTLGSMSAESAKRKERQAAATRQPPERSFVDGNSRPSFGALAARLNQKSEQHQ